MSEEIAQGLPRGSFEERVLSELSGIRQELGTRLTSVEERLTSVEGQMTSLEDKVDARLRETRPIWEGVLARLDGIESELARMNRQFRSFVADIFQLRVRVEKLEEYNDTQTA
jgi:predicted nuclease with TOPRIM domain